MPNWIVTADYSASAFDLAKQLEAIGLRVVQVLDVIGAVEVHGSEELVRKAADVPGVASIERDVPFDVGPPNSDLS